MLIDIRNLAQKNILSPLYEGAEGFLITQLQKQSDLPILAVVRDDKRMNSLAANIKMIEPNSSIIFIPAWDCLPYDRISPAPHIASARTEGLCELLLLKNNPKKKTVILTTVNSLLQKLPPQELLVNLATKVNIGDILDREDFVRHLVRSGYINSPTANEAGEFAIRGSILDIIPCGSEQGYRLDFFGDKVENIRFFDPLTQISGGKSDNLSIMPASEVLLDEENISLFRKQYREKFGAVTKSDPLYEAISAGRHYAGMEHWLPLFYPHMDSFFEYLPQNTIIFFDHLAAEARHERHDLVDDYFQSRSNVKELGFSASDNYHPIEPDLLYLTEKDWEQQSSAFKCLYANPFNVESATAYNPLSPLGDRVGNTPHQISGNTPHQTLGNTPHPNPLPKEGEGIEKGRVENYSSNSLSLFGERVENYSSNSLSLFGERVGVRGQRDNQLIENARNLRKNQTEVEKKLWSELRGRRFGGYKFRRQHDIEKYIVDFVCLDKKLIIELDGGQHAEQKEHDKKRTKFLESKGYRVIRFWNNQVIENLEGVLENIQSVLKNTPHQISGNTPHPNPLPKEGEGIEKGRVENYSSNSLSLFGERVENNYSNPLSPSGERVENYSSNSLSLFGERVGVRGQRDNQLIENAHVNSLPLKSVPDFSVQSKATRVNAVEIFGDYLMNFVTHNKNDKRPILISCYSVGSRERIKSILKEHDYVGQFIDKWSGIKKLSENVIGLVILDIEHGFEHPDFILISEQDLLGTRLGRKKAKSKRSDNFLQEVSSLSKGELVVHKDHGIGRFEELETLNISGENHDCLRIIYANGDKLYVPVENIDVLSRYGSDNETAKLDKLGHTSWQSRKASLKKRIKIIAEDLLKTAAARALRKGQPMRPMEGLYEEFCSRFAYAETDDQLRCIEEVAQDLSSGKPMDRLICGDVGFGKTEVALRAAFIAASDGEHKQVALIAPTTLLCRQHYKTFKERFAGMPFEVRMLCRLTSAKSAKETKSGLKEGKVDIVIGTHALLAKSIEFKDLGLVIIDEEQQFGVAQKERFKQMRSNIHILTLSATPIPRTLQMSLSGIKDLSLIATPPVDRLAIRTYTMPFDPVVIRNAILREFYRGGRTFFVVPRIKDLDEVHEKLAKLVPEVKLTRAHGQLTPNELDQTMNDFYDGHYDVLLSTNIVGSGIDLPMANTIIVYRADMFGLSQLYQMRGRVGRSKVRAYAYLTTPPKRIPGEIAMKRLEIMQNLDSLGAGFTLASHDMDIRGFGNLVGDEQSGQIKEVGVELYQAMLKEAIERAKAESTGDDESDESFSPNINMGISVMIPEDYVSDLQLRMGLYRRIANLQENDDVEEIAVELVDRFGALPEPLHNLLEIMKIKILCIKAGVEKIDAGPKGITLKFHNDKFKNPEALITYITKNPLTTKLRGDQKLVIFKEYNSSDERLKGTRKSLENIINIAS
ncbi:transcription-repair coupling factor [Rickettsiales bacterium]|nr:transcription-repair coupling factor [Rickettsiales bacterium]